MSAVQICVGKNSPVMAAALQSSEKAKCKLQETEFEKHTGEMEWTPSKKRCQRCRKDQDFSSSTAYTVVEINVDLGTTLSLVPWKSQNLCVLAEHKTPLTD